MRIISATITLCILSLAACSNDSSRSNAPYSGDASAHPASDANAVDVRVADVATADTNVSDSRMEADATLPTPELCSWLEAGARFETTELLWCSAGWPGDGEPPGPDVEPDLYCNWSLTFEDGQVDWIKHDYGGLDPFTCSGDTVTIENRGKATWDPARRVLTFDGVEYLPVD